MVGGHNVQIKKKDTWRKTKKTWLFEWKTQIGLAFGPVFTWQNGRNFNPSRRLNPRLKNGYLASGADPPKRLQAFTEKGTREPSWWFSSG